MKTKRNEKSYLILNEAQSTKVLQYKEELDEFYQYPNLLYIKEYKKVGSFLDFFRRDRTLPIFYF